MYVDLRGKELSFEVVDSKFRRIQSKKEITKFINDRVVYNGILARLESIEDLDDRINLQFSRTEFFDLMSTNLALNKENCNVDIKESVEGKSGLDHLNNDLLSNGVAISLLLEVEDKVILTRRSYKVAISENKFGVSVTGSMDMNDLFSLNPIEETCRRETMEELGRDVFDLEVLGLYIGENKIQPTFLCKGRIEDIDRLWEDFFEENQKLLKVKKEDVLKFANMGMTEAAKFHLNLLYENYGG